MNLKVSTAQPSAQHSTAWGAPAMNLKSAAPVMTPSKTYTAALMGSMATAIGSTARTAAPTSAAGRGGEAGQVSSWANREAGCRGVHCCLQLPGMTTGCLLPDMYSCCLLPAMCGWTLLPCMHALNHAEPAAPHTMRARGPHHAPASLLKMPGMMGSASQKAAASAAPAPSPMPSSRLLTARASATSPRPSCG